MSIDHHGHEHEFEPQFGLPERLPPDERILWQGSPDFRTVALRVFHLRKLAIYFAVLVLLKDAAVVSQGGTAAQVAWGLAWPWLLSAAALGTLAGMAWLTCRTAVYTLTDKRVVMRIGIVLTLTFNLPYRMIESAALRRQRGDVGDIVLALAGPDRIAYLHLWPHVRPWHLKRPEPMLRALPQADTVARTLVAAWSAATGQAAAPLPAASPAASPAAAPAASPAPTWHGGQVSPT